tara:strand:+ start:63 stop:212 length:150 start_codon:yes stop_codon:yes gene_type:complete
MIKTFAILALIILSGCQPVPDFPNVFSFQSQQDLIDQADEIDRHFNKDR